MKFESPAEKAIYPIIRTLAIENKLEFDYQKSFTGRGFNLWVYRKYGDDIPDWILEHECEDHIGDNDECYVCSNYEKYRADFVLRKRINHIYIKKLIIEIDGEQYHQDLQKEKHRDSYFKSLDYEVLHVSAFDAINKPIDVKHRILRMFNTKPMVITK